MVMMLLFLGIVIGSLCFFIYKRRDVIFKGTQYMVILTLLFITILLFAILSKCKSCQTKSIIESYFNESLQSCSFDNVIGNDLFKDGQQSNQVVSTDPHFKIVPYLNPGDASYCLSQFSSNETSAKNAYQLSFNIIPGNQYVFQIWHTHDYLWNSLIQPFQVSYDTTQSNVVALSYRIANTIQLGNSSCNTWQLLEAVLSIPTNANTSMSWLIGYPANISTGIGYWSRPRVKKFRPSIQDFPITYGIQSFAVSYHPHSNGQQQTQTGIATKHAWKDISNEGHDYYWTTVPQLNTRQGYELNDNVLYGEICSNLGLGTDTTTPFTIVLVYGGNKDGTLLKLFGEPVATTDESTNDIISQNVLSLSFVNSQLQLSHSNNTPIAISVGLTNIQSCYFIINDGKGKLSIWKDTLLVYTSPAGWFQPYQWSSSKRMIFNSTHNLYRCRLAGILTYNTALCTQDIEIVKTYLYQHFNHIEEPELKDQSCAYSVSTSTCGTSTSNCQQLKQQVHERMMLLQQDMHAKLEPIMNALMNCGNIAEAEEHGTICQQLEQQKGELIARYKQALTKIHGELQQLELQCQQQTSGPVTSEEMSQSQSSGQPVKCSTCNNGTRYNYNVYGNGTIRYMSSGYSSSYDHPCPDPLSVYACTSNSSNSNSNSNSNNNNSSNSNSTSSSSSQGEEYNPNNTTAYNYYSSNNYNNNTNENINTNTNTNTNININQSTNNNSSPTYINAQDHENYYNMSVDNMTNQFDNGPFIRSFNHEPPETCYNKHPNPDIWIKKTEIPCWEPQFDD